MTYTIGDMLMIWSWSWLGHVPRPRKFVSKGAKPLCPKVLRGVKIVRIVAMDNSAIESDGKSVQPCYPCLSLCHPARPRENESPLQAQLPCRVANMLQQGPRSKFQGPRSSGQLPTFCHCKFTCSPLGPPEEPLGHYGL